MFKLYGSHTHEVAERILTAFKQPERLPKALAPIFIRRMDGVPCRTWSWHNQLLIALCGTMDARGVRQWQSAGRKLKKGSKAIWILAPCLKSVKLRENTGEETTRQALYGFRSIPVFAVEDTEGDPLPDHDVTWDNWIQELPLIDVAEKWGIQVGSYSHRGQAPMGYYQRGIRGEAIMLGVENLSTWTHELVHAADSRVTGLKDAKWCKEVVAELGGAVLLECLDMRHDADLGGAYDYITSYAVSANKDVVSACVEVIGRVCECVKLILDTATAVESRPNESQAVLVATAQSA